MQPVAEEQLVAAQAAQGDFVARGAHLLANQVGIESVDARLVLGREQLRQRRQSRGGGQLGVVVHELQRLSSALRRWRFTTSRPTASWPASWEFRR